MSAQKITLALLRELRACYFHKPTGDPDRLRMEKLFAGEGVTFAEVVAAWPEKADVVWVGVRVLPLVVVRKFAKNCAGRAKNYAAAAAADAAASWAAADAAAGGTGPLAGAAADAAAFYAADASAASDASDASAASCAARSAERDLQVKDLLALEKENK